MEAAAYALVGEDGHLSDDAETGQPGGWHRSRVPMAISHDGARGSPSAHATMPMTEPGSRSMRTAEQLAELILYQSVVESEEAGGATAEGGAAATELGTSDEEILSNLIQRASAQPLARSRAVGLVGG